MLIRTENFKPIDSIFLKNLKFENSCNNIGNLFSPLVEKVFFDSVPCSFDYQKNENCQNSIYSETSLKIYFLNKKNPLSQVSISKLMKSYIYICLKFFNW